LYRASDYPLEAADLDRLRADGIDQLFIRADDANAYHNYLCEHVLYEPKVPTAFRIQALREVTRVAFENALGSNDCDQMVGLASKFGRDLATLVLERTIVFRDLFTTLEHDYYTFTHVCNVSMYCATIACRLGPSSESELADIAQGALLHDIGKRHIPPHVLNKPGKLTDAEWELVREHPGSGFRELASRKDLTWAQLMMVYQHHERLNGKGYPAGVTGEDIHPWARICAVADVFDALTCHRPYRRAVPVAGVCEYLKKHTDDWFDAEIVDCWTDHVRRLA
jgi:HD-GYP domain-containing protein (c-di-GMP phosphodiesterase class II)